MHADRLFKFISTKTGVKPFKIILDISDDHVKAGTIISPPLSKISLRTEIESKFAEEPEFTKILYFTPNHLDHFFQNHKHFYHLLILGLSF